MIQSPARRAFAAGLLAAGMLLSGAAPGLAQQKSEIAITRQPGIIYLPTHIIEKRGLIEKHAERLGVPGVKTKWLTFSGGGSQTDARFAEQHTQNPLGIGVTVDDLVRAMRFILQTPTFTGDTLIVDSGEHLTGRPRDIAFDRKTAAKRKA